MIEEDALLVIGAQNQFLCRETGGRFSKKHRRIDDITQQLVRAVEAARRNKRLVVWICSEYEHDHRETDGKTGHRAATYSGKAPCCQAGTAATEMYAPMRMLVHKDTDVMWTKRTYSAFNGGEGELLRQELADVRGVRSVAICGVHTNICVLATALDAKQMFAYASVIEPATAAFTVTQHARALDQMHASGVHITTLGNIMQKENDGRGELYGAGDSFLLCDVLPSASDADACFQTLREDATLWHHMRHKGSDVPRLISMQATIESNGMGSTIIPVYRHPADEQPPLRPFVPCLDEARCFLQDALAKFGATKPIMNHAIVQMYRGGEDSISSHTDKTLDILHDTPICNLSLGATRILLLRHKNDSKRVQRIPLPHNSVFVLGWRTNREWSHEIRADKRPSAEKTVDERAFGGVRISATFRAIGTFQQSVAGGRTMIFGQGAPTKSQPGVVTLAPGTADAHTQQARMLHAFADENRNAEFDWNASYGHGFSVLDLSGFCEVTR